MKVINLDKHDVDIYDEQGNYIKTYKASGIVARTRTYFEEVDYIDGVPFVVRKTDKIVGLPKPQKDTIFIVSNVILNECPDRTDLFAPAKLVYDDNHRVIGCQALAGNR